MPDLGVMDPHPATVAPVRAALFQGPWSSATVDDNLRALVDAASRASDAGASILITPEMSVTGYDIGPAIAERAEPRRGPAHRTLVAAAAQTGLTIVYGIAERTTRGVRNAVRVVEPTGEVVATYRKTHLFGDLDRSAFVPGDELVVQFDHRGVRCGLLICYDVEFPETVRAHADSGTQWVIVPTGLMTPYDVVAERVVPARAYESQVFVSYVNRCGRESTLEYTGLSCTVGPDGADLVRAGRGEELLIVTIDADQVERSRRVNTHLSDRRRDLYPPSLPAPRQENPS